jgi:hypothetical protein
MTDPVVPEPGLNAANPPAPPPAVAKSPALSILALIAGILGVLVGVIGAGFLFSVAGVVLGHLGQHKEPEARGFWLTGLITGYLGVVLNVIVLIFWVALWLALLANGDLGNMSDFYNYR